VKKNNNQRNIHPFPARMAPEIAIKAVSDLKPGDIILDPMVGSGTVLHQAALSGFTPVGFDLDPLAVLMSKVRTNKINDKKLVSFYESILRDVKVIRLNQTHLPWIDDDGETKEFIKFWFARKQINVLRKIAHVLNIYKSNYKNCIEIDVLRIALSRIIITKKVGASLAWDISHSRPHKMRDSNDYDVLAGFKNSVNTVRKALIQQNQIKKRSKINLGDARNLRSIPDGHVDKVITSPPYLNAIDYMRGHKFSLVWLGYSIPQLREIRSTSIGAEKKLGSISDRSVIDKIYDVLFDNANLQDKQTGMIKRYINDSILLMSEISRVLKKGKEAVLVVGNSNLNGVYIENSEVFNQAGKLVGLNLSHITEREIPITKRYLPLPKSNSNSLSKRMKHEVIMSFINKGKS
jgi:tRNA G10  N-methylase Trm11